MKAAFHRIARFVTDWSGTVWATLLAFLAVGVWFAGGLHRGFSTDYQMYINTGTTIVTFLMVFLIQHTQNRDGRVMHLKLDELIRAHRGARNSLINLEEMTDAELDALQVEFRAHRERRAERRRRKAMPNERNNPPDKREEKQNDRKPVKPEAPRKPEQTPDEAAKMGAAIQPLEQPETGPAVH